MPVFGTTNIIYRVRVSGAAGAADSSTELSDSATLVRKTDTVNDLTTGGDDVPLSADAGVALAKGEESKPLVVANGQTAITLPSVPVYPDSVTLVVNGVVYRVPDGHITVSGAVVTWAGPFTLSASDKVNATYI